MNGLANTTNMIMKSEILVKKTTPSSLTLEDGDTCVYPTLIDKSSNFVSKVKLGKKSVLES